MPDREFWEDIVTPVVIVKRRREWEDQQLAVMDARQRVLGGYRAVSYTHLDVYKRQL